MIFGSKRKITIILYTSLIRILHNNKYLQFANWNIKSYQHIKFQSWMVSVIKYTLKSCALTHWNPKTKINANKQILLTTSSKQIVSTNGSERSLQCLFSIHNVDGDIFVHNFPVAGITHASHMFFSRPSFAFVPDFLLCWPFFLFKNSISYIGFCKCNYYWPGSLFHWSP